MKAGGHFCAPSGRPRCCGEDVPPIAARRSTHFGDRIHGGSACVPDLDYCNYLIVIGANPAAAGGAPENPLFAKARERGMKTIAIDPVLSP
jgi:anaerobic selenocysteine-containing dehydrogenase